MTLLTFLVTLSLLVVVHEFGHYLLARILGFRVLVFSVGFGKPLWQRTAVNGIRYQFAAIPLGGYVKMDGENPEEKSDDPAAYQNRPAWARLIVASAGPIFNLILAVIIFTVIGFIGTQQLPATITLDNQFLDRPLDQPVQILAINDVPTVSGESFVLELSRYIGESDSIQLNYVDIEGNTGEVILSPPAGVGKKAENLLSDLGIDITLPLVPAEIFKVGAESAAAKAGLQSADRVLSVNGSAITTWFDLVEAISASSGEALDLNIRRQGADVQLTVLPEDDGQGNYKLGIAVDPQRFADMYVYQKYHGFAAVNFGWNEMWHRFGVIVDNLWSMVAAKTDVSGLSGPIGIANVAEQARQAGLVSWLGLLGLLSVSLGVLNLLPVPVLDGGHIVFNAIETVLRRPIPLQVYSFANMLGLFFILSLMGVAIFNDLARIF